MWAAGVLAPAVTPMRPAPSNQDASSSSAPSMWWVRGHSPAAISARRLVFAEMRPPTTTMTSASLASSAQAPWWPLVASQIVLTTRSSSARPSSAATTSCRFERDWVVWTTTPIFLQAGTRSASAADPTTMAPSACGSVASTSGWPFSPTTTTW